MTTYDANGNTLSDSSGKQYSWDFENRLTQAVVPGTGTVNFRYDRLQREASAQQPGLSDAAGVCGAGQKHELWKRRR